MLKGLTALEHKIGDRTYQLLCAHDAPVGEVHDALIKMYTYVVERINEQQKVVAEKTVEQPKAETCEG